ncbi:MAG: DUF3352 domain-containing protein, partial [Chloroflexota bacterium]|nr:DUF3352 domain-containing protein [Chloroflexota bacterium]
MGAAFSPFPEGLQLEYALIRPQGTSARSWPQNGNKAAAFVPADAVAYFSGRDLSRRWRESRAVVDRLLLSSGMRVSSEDWLKFAGAATGLDLDKDVFGWMEGEYGVAVLPKGEKAVEPLFIIEDSRGKAPEKMAIIRNAMERTGVPFQEATVKGVKTYSAAGGMYYAILEGFVVAGASQEDLAASIFSRQGGATALARDKVFTSGVARLPGSDLVFYLDLSYLLRSSGGTGSPSAEVLRTVRAMFFSWGDDGKKGRGSLIVSLQPGEAGPALGQLQELRGTPIPPTLPASSATRPASTPTPAGPGRTPTPPVLPTPTRTATPRPTPTPIAKAPLKEGSYAIGAEGPVYYESRDYLARPVRAEGRLRLESAVVQGDKIRIDSILVFTTSQGFGWVRGV